MRTIKYISLSIFILGVILFVCPTYNIYALDTSYNDNVVNSVSGEGTEQDYKDLYAQTMLAQAIIDGGQVDFSRVDTPISWVDFVDSITTPILQSIDDASPINLNLAGINSRINECLIDYYENGIVRNMNSSLSIPSVIPDVWSQMMRSKAQKSYIGGGGTSVGETLLQIAKDFYELNKPEEEQAYLPEDYIWIQNINNFYYDYINIYNAKFDHYGDVYLPSLNLNNCTLVSNRFIYNSYNGHIYDSSNTNINIKFNVLNGIMSIYLLINNDESVTATYSQHSPISFIPDINYIYEIANSTFEQNILFGGFVDGSFTYNQSNFSGLSSALNYIYEHYCNINLYVNGQLWINSNDNPNIIKFGGVTVDSGNNPMELNIPDFYSFDYGRFKDIILDAINHSSVVMYEDIADCFLDINGQTCIATYSVVRNDYDDLVSEQFNMVSYPRFNSDLYTQTLVNQFRDDTETGVQIIKNSYSIYPQTLTDALLYCGLLILFGLLIRRFLE